MEAVLKWAHEIYPRTQDDMMPILLLLKDVISKVGACEVNRGMRAWPHGGTVPILLLLMDVLEIA